MTIVSDKNKISQEKKKKHIFLLGYMGSGKSMLGGRLAQILDKDCIDTDDTIEARAGMTITEIFSQVGEAGFRNLEKQFLEELVPHPPSIISTGGGMPCYNEGLGLMKATGILIYLEASIDVLVDRLWQEKHKRPLLSHLNDKATLFEFVNRHLSERQACYQKSDYTVNAHLDADQLIEKLMLIPGVAENTYPGL